jgi:hypothetical protein
MSIYRNNSKVWVMDFMFCAQRIRESTHTRSKSLAKKIEDKRRRELEAAPRGSTAKGIGRCYSQLPLKSTCK